MTTRDVPWPTGTPCWVDCAFEPEHRGMHHAVDFYGKLFGWRIEDGATTDGYRDCLKDDRRAAGLTAKQHEDEPTAWVTYLATDDIEATCAAVRSAGGAVTREPTTIPHAGRMAFCSDPTGAVFGLWQAHGHEGFGITNEPDTVTWNDLLTRDLEVAKTFYAEVFGWSYDEAEASYLLASLGDGSRIAGLHLAQQLPEDAPAHWLTHFAVVDRDASAQIAQELGGEILMTADTPMGPEAVIRGKQGEIFALIAPTS